MITLPNEQATRLQIAAIVSRLGLPEAGRLTGLTRHQLMTLSGGHKVHRGTLAQAQQALAISAMPTPGDVG